ncbi:hypothetical protein ACHAWX_001159 [Stephanocyclus meneghinianus]
MVRKKGKQCGIFHCKKLNAEYHHKLFVDNASEADQYRNPVSKNILGKGLGYRSATTCNNSVGRWDSNGHSCRGDKWSSIFANRPSAESSLITTRSSTSNTSHNQNAARGLAYLRHLLEERRSEDRVHDRQHRLALQQSRIRDAHLSAGSTARNNTVVEEMQFNQSMSEKLRNEPGWLLSHSFESSFDPKHSSQSMGRHSSPDNLHQNDVLDNSTVTRNQYSTENSIPSLQSLTAQVLGPLLPVYVAACGHEYVGECLKSASPEIIAMLSVSLARSSSEYYRQDDAMVYATTDGTAKALACSGVATGLVLKGAPLVMSKYHKVNDQENIDDNDDTRWLSDQGLLALRPRLLPQTTKKDDATSFAGIENNDDWETLNVDFDLSTRMAGCFHLTRLELVDIPLQCLPCTRGGITLRALRTVLQSCPGITHLSLAGSFCNWANSGSNLPPRVFRAARDASEDVSILLCGTASTLSRVQTWTANSRDQLGQYDYDHYSDEACDIMGLHQLLPELRVLDVSSCSWITPTMIFRFLLQCRDEMTRVYNVSTSAQSSDGDEWEQKYAVAGNGRVDKISGASDSVSTQHLPSISLQLLSVMGCNFSWADAHMIEEWVNSNLSGNLGLLTGLS